MNSDIPFDLVRSKLAELERVESCRVLLAVESGSRAWGFPSEDSDFDVRFIYVRPTDWYLSIDEGRDVIERPLDKDAIDLSGWDLPKALRLLRKSNPPLLEWLQSPIIYSENFNAPQRLRELMQGLYSPISCMHHYLHMAEGNFRTYLRSEEVRVKKYFYVLRPVLACRWVEAGMGLVPMEFSKLVDTVLDDGAVKDEVCRLLEEKKSGVELESGPRRPVLNDFLQAELERLANVAQHKAEATVDTEKLNKMFRQTLTEVWN